MNHFKKKQRDFSSGKMWKNITAQAVPLTVAQLVQLLYNIVDRIYIGHLPHSGSLALAGIGLTFPVTTLILAFSNLFGTGGAPLFSIERGRGHQEKASEIMGNVFTMILISSVIIMTLCRMFLHPILILFGASSSTLPYAQDYLSVYLTGILFSMSTSGMNGFISALGFPGTAMLTTVIGAVLNLILDPIFIFGLSLGVKGAAAATVISQIVSAVWVIRFLSRKEIEISLKLPDMKLKKHTVLSILGLGVSGFMQQATNSVVQVVCNVTLQNYGGDLYVGIMTIISSIREIAQLPVNGITSGAQPVLGYNYGAGKNDRVRQGIRFVSLAGIIYTAVLWLTIEFFPAAFIRFFSNDTETLVSGIHAVRIYFLGFVFMSLQFVGQSVFVSLGKAKRAVFFSLLRKVIIVVPLTLIFPMLWGLGTDGVFLAEPVSNLIGGTASFLTMWITLYCRL